MDRSPDVAPAEDPDVAVTFTATLIDQWRRRGVRHVIVSPGSRSTPLVIGLQWVLDRQSGDAADWLQAHLVLDERSAAFQAVGVARATGAPAVLMCTSGTAAVEYHPAVVEAHLAALPLLICTADRPPELRDTGAPQTIDQRELYGTSMRAYLEPGPPTVAGRDGWRALADETFNATTGARPGPVQLNLGFREPLVGSVGELPPADDGRDRTPTVRPLTAAEVDALIARCSGRRVVVVAGERAVTGWGRYRAVPHVRRKPSSTQDGSSGPADAVGRQAAAVLDLARVFGWPVLADPLLSLRLNHASVVPNFDPMLRSNAVADALRPEVVIRLGALVSSKVTNQWLADVPEQVAIDPAGWFPDPDRVVTLSIQADPAQVIEALADVAAERRLDPAPNDWAGRWRRVSAAVEEALAHERPDVVEPAALAAALDGVPNGGHLVVSSSMPVRDLEWFGPLLMDGVTVHANRGANGIDGVIATAVGIARTGAPTAVVVGDLAMLHDVGSLVSATALDSLAVIVVDNDGGGIFSFLPQQRMLPEGDFERWWGTPSGLDLAAIAAGFGLDVVDVAASELTDAVRDALTPDDPGASLRRSPLFRVVSDRSANLAQHQRLLVHLADTAESALGPDA